MQGLKIEDKSRNGNFLEFDLRELLATIGSPVSASTWRCRDVECVGKNAGELHGISDAAREITGSRLQHIASGITQTIDGIFEGYRNEDVQPWLRIEAVDSSWFEVWSNDAEVLEKVRFHFKGVTDLLPDSVS